jgi:hypothetical protein
MRMTKKGLKMNISKCLKNYDIEKSEEVTTEIRGKHNFTNGYRFFDMNYEHDYVMLFWEDDNLTKEEKAGIIKNIFEILDKHGFSEYMKLNDSSLEIILQGYRD